MDFSWGLVTTLALLAGSIAVFRGRQLAWAKGFALWVFIGAVTLPTNDILGVSQRELPSVVVHVVVALAAWAGVYWYFRRQAKASPTEHAAKAGERLADTSAGRLYLAARRLAAIYWVAYVVRLIVVTYHPLFPFKFVGDALAGGIPLVAIVALRRLWLWVRTGKAR